MSFAHVQCDQMARLFAQYLAIYNNEKWPNGNFSSMFIYNFDKKSSKRAKFGKSGHTGHLQLLLKRLILNFNER